MSFLRQGLARILIWLLKTISDLLPSKELTEEAWKRLAMEIGAEFIKGRRGFLQPFADKVVAEVKEWTITLDTYSVTSLGPGWCATTTFTQMAAHYATMADLQVERSPDGTPMARRTDRKPLTPADYEEARRLAKDAFQFTIYRKGFFSAVRKLLGIQDIEVGDPDFDRDFIIKANNKSKAQALFANPRIRQLIHQQSSLNLSVRKHELFCELYFREPHLIWDVIRLKSLFELFEETLNHLCRIG